ncbi:MAG: DUF559 domain-containing protein [Dehalococcoidia bacterium]|nr:DUF559 domain-containing protein [Dehalococcoidia bacterium]
MGPRHAAGRGRPGEESRACGSGPALADTSEKLLWEALRGRALHGCKFRRQYPIDSFVADFCCVKARLIVDLDGGAHLGRRSADEERDRRLGLLGYRVLRISNDDVSNDISAVLARIAEALTSQG